MYTVRRKRVRAFREKILVGKYYKSKGKYARSRWRSLYEKKVWVEANRIEDKVIIDAMKRISRKTSKRALWSREKASKIIARIFCRKTKQ